MAYDPKDPADVKIVSDAVAEALENARDEHETEIEGLKTKNKDLLTKLSKARKDTGDGSAEEVTRLESELDTARTELATANSKARQLDRDLKAVTATRDTVTAELETERKAATGLVVENDLTAALTSVNVAPHLFDGAKALLGNGVTVKEVDGKRQAFVGDKPLGEHVKEWSLGDQGKHYVTAADNSGGNDGQHKPHNVPGNKKISEMNHVERTALLNTLGEVKFNERFTAEKAGN